MPSRSFTFTAHGGLLRELKTKCHVTQEFTPAAAAGGKLPAPKEFDAVWDTGASGTVITQRVVDECGLAATGMAQVRGVNSAGTSPVFRIALLLPNHVGFSGIHVTLGDLGAGGPDVLIGMDIITMGDFSVTNKDGVTVFSFRVPSRIHTDYVKQHKSQAGANKSFSPKRNRRNRR